MVRYIENRIWMLNATLLDTARPEEEVQRILDSAGPGLFLGGGARFSWSENPVGNYSNRPRSATLTLEAGSRSTFQEALSKKGVSYRLSEFRMRVDPLGFLDLRIQYEFTGKLDPDRIQELDANGDAASEVVDDFFDDISGAVDALGMAGVLRTSEFYPFGTPPMLSKLELHSAFYSYNYTAHLLFDGEPAAHRAMIDRYGPGAPSMNFEGHSLRFVFPFHIWETSRILSDEDVDRLVSIGAYATAETATCNTALQVYNAFLRAINLSRGIEADGIRRIVNHNTWLLQSLRLFNPNFTLFEFQYLKMYREHSDLSPKYALLKDAEASLTFAIEGVEAATSHRSERVMQFILSIFTALTLYSVTTDIYSLVTSDVKEIPFTTHSLQAGIFLAETTVVVAMAWLFKRMNR